VNGFSASDYDIAWLRDAMQEKMNYHQPSTLHSAERHLVWRLIIFDIFKPGIIGRAF